MDISSVQAGLASIQSAIELTKIVSGAAGTLEKAEHKLKIAEIISALADAKISLADAGQTIADLQNNLRARNERESMRTWFVDGVYIAIDANGKAIDGPFCGRCLDVDHAFIRPANDRSGERGMGYCPQCKNRYPLWNAEKRLVDDGVISEFTG